MPFEAGEGLKDKKAVDEEFAPVWRKDDLANGASAVPEDKQVRGGSEGWRVFTAQENRIRC